MPTHPLPQDLLTLSQTDAFTPLPPTLLATIFTNPPFIPLPSTFNTRDLGLLPGSPIRPGLVYRTGGFLGGISPAGAAALATDLRIKKVFDLRSAREHDRQPDPEVEGVEMVWVKPGEGGAVDMGLYEEGEGERGVVRGYMEVLRLYGGGIRGVLEQVRDGRGEEVVLFHCNAGRDRTGVVAGLLLTLAGASEELIVFDYMLSRIGIEPAREKLLESLTKGLMNVNINAPGFRNLANLRASCWKAFVKAVEAEYGGFEGYVTGFLGFTEEELARIKSNLIRQN
ncbi:protein-tyrosine phosphatase-like protein [Chaetomium tenue]|uniref:Protein-tyrosine phosphatase-like protein n=1 Tax=Chaetomium tenue TaxID=1854479 RepID=A0ACB7PLY7_9PEZI|nr:protein-tyrosine phosphatase-like protein [Chaetomium globosum]